MLLDWAFAEAKPMGTSGQIAADLQARVEARVQLDQNDRQALVNGILKRRGHFVASFLTPGTRWFVGTCSSDSIGSIGLCKWFQGRHQLAGGRVEHFLSLGALADGDPNLKTTTPYDPALLFGRPILVSERLEGPWCLVEGTHRLVEEYRIAKNGGFGGPAREVILGVCPSAASWIWWTPPPNPRAAP